MSNSQKYIDTLNINGDIRKIRDSELRKDFANFIETNVIYDNPLLTFNYNGAWQSQKVVIENIKPDTQYTFSVKSITGVGNTRSYLYCLDNEGNELGNFDFSPSVLTKTFVPFANTTKIKIVFFASEGTSTSGTARFEGIELIEGTDKIYILNKNILVNIPNNSVSSNKIVDNSITPKKTTFIKDNLIYENPLISFNYNGSWQSQQLIIENIKENTQYNISFKSINGTYQDGYVYFRNSEGSELGNKAFNKTILSQTFYTPAGTIKMDFRLYATGDTSYSGTAIYEGLEIVEGEEREYKLDTNIKISTDITKYNLPIIYLSGSLENISKDNKVTLNYVYGDLKGTCTLKWQGQGSLQYPKKNYTINFDNSFEAKEGWGSQKKYCLKANYLDFSHARNVVSAKLWGQMVKTRTNVPTQLSGLVNGGGVDGFPCCLVINGEYQGIYTFNIPKDKWTFGMGSGTNECIISSELDSEMTGFKEPIVIDNVNFEYEYITDENNTEWVTTSLNNLYNALQNATKDNFESTVGQYLDLESAVDYNIMVGLFNAIDCKNKNYLLVSYGGKWLLSAYDLDCTFGLHFSPRIITPDDPLIETYQYVNKIMECIHKFYKDKLKERYLELRNGVLSEGNVATEFLNFAGVIPKTLYNKEVEIWNEVPLSSVNNVHQIISFYEQRCKFSDKLIEKL